MRNAALIFNPVSGTRRRHREGDIDSVKAVLCAAGVKVELVPTLGPRTGAAQALQLVRQGFDTLIVCGGNGTVNAVVQGLVKSGGQGQLGLIPLGCGNLLSKELGVPADPAQAARALLTARPQRVRLGIIEYHSDTDVAARLYWIVAAGIGADAQVICKINPQHKARHGICAYYVESARQLLSGRDFQPFLVEWQEPESGQWRTEVVMRVVAERVTYFGNCLKSLVPGEELAREDLHVILFKNKSRWKYLQYGCQLIGLRLGVPPKEIRDVELVRARELVCREASNADVPDGGSGVRAEVLAATDGELLGRLPVRLSIAPDAVTVLRPSPSSAIY